MILVMLLFVLLSGRVDKQTVSHHSLDCENFLLSESILEMLQTQSGHEMCWPSFREITRSTKMVR
ncbi:hypothetical protein SAMN04488133_3014 [Halobellus limi]|uniref:Uncharacterized protein n=1 Tax=Halobellus limi TaxID=699433 RepID=A0A1H6BTJ3_9EURY|nr:hypothetical protein SAMN04488133_3014 [Halobellus limi]